MLVARSRICVKNVIPVTSLTLLYRRHGNLGNNRSLKVHNGPGCQLSLFDTPLNMPVSSTCAWEGVCILLTPDRNIG